MNVIRQNDLPIATRTTTLDEDGMGIVLESLEPTEIYLQ